MTQSIIEKLEALLIVGTIHHDNEPEYVRADDLRAIIEEAKAEKQEPVAVLSLKNTELTKRVAVLEDLLSSAYTIANRKGIDTHWFRFCAQLHINGISPVTAKTFKILPSDPKYTTPQPDIIAELVKALEHSRECLEAANNSGLINDTLWAGNAETLFDYMDAAVTRAKEYLK